MKNITLSMFCLLLLGTFLQAQNTTQNFVYFDSDDHNLSKEYETSITDIYDQLINHSDFEIKIIGHTDQDGTEEYNQALAQKRAESVLMQLVDQGASIDQIEIVWEGETQLLDETNTASAKQKNRRVEILTHAYDYEDIGDVIETAHEVNIQHYNLDATQEQVIDCDAGSTVIIPENAFTFADGSPIGDANLTIEIKEAFSYSDFISEGLFTHSKGEMLETGGMMYINATADGKEVALREGQSLEIIYPLQETKDGMELFYAENDENGNLDWSQANQNIGTTDVKKEDLIIGLNFDDLLNYDFGVLKKPVLSFEKLPARPKVRKMPHPPAKPQYGFPADYKKYEEKYQNYEKALSDYYIQKPLEEEKLADWNVEVTNRISQIWQYKKDFKEIHAQVQAKSGILKIKEHIDKRSEYQILRMFNAILDRGLTLKIDDKKLFRKAFGNEMRNIKRERHITIQETDYSKYKVANIVGGVIKRSLNDLKNKALELEYEKTGKVDGRGFSSYITSINQLGWINCDRFTNYSEKCDLYVKDESNGTQYFLIFDDIKSMLRPSSDNGGVVFSNIPENMNVKILGIRLVDSKPYIAVKEYKTKDTNVLNMDFQPGSLSMIKNELSKLENPLDDIVIYPNPTSSILSINNLDTQLDYNINIIDNSGREALASRTTNNSYNYDVSTLENGMYFIRIEDTMNQSSKTLQFVKN